MSPYRFSRLSDLSPPPNIGSSDAPATEASAPPASSGPPSVKEEDSNATPVPTSVVPEVEVQQKNLDSPEAGGCAIAFAPAIAFTTPLPNSRPLLIPPEIPRNVQMLLRDWMRTNQTATVPTSIYCLQGHRIFSTLSKKGDNGSARHAVYIHTHTGLELVINAYRLPWMTKKNSEKLLVATGHPLTEAIVLARVKSHSNEFRAWGGAHDDENGETIVVRRVVEDQSGLQKAGPATPEGGAATKRKPQNAVHSNDADVLNREKKARSSTDFTSTYSPLVDRPNSTLARSSTRSTASRFPKDASKASRTTLTFGTGKARKSRTLEQCSTYAKLFANALAADLIPEDPRYHVLLATINGREGGLRIVDELDFADLVEEIESDDCWEEDGATCAVHVQGYLG